MEAIQETATVPEASPPETKTVEERLAILEQENMELKQAIMAADGEFKYMFSVFQDILGIRLIRDKQTQRFGYMVQVPKNSQGAPGVVADLHLKMEKLWKRYGGEIILAR